MGEGRLARACSSLSTSARGPCVRVCVHVHVRARVRVRSRSGVFAKHSPCAGGNGWAGSAFYQFVDLHAFVSISVEVLSRLSRRRRSVWLSRILWNIF